MKKLFLPLFLLLCINLHAQELHGYRFESGESAAEWITLTNYETVDSFSTPIFDLGFEFYFFGNSYRRISINKQGAIRFDNIYETRHSSPIQPFGSAAFMKAPPFILPFGISLIETSNSYVHYKVIGSEGDRTLVCEFFLSSYRNGSSSSSDCKFQVHLRESNGSITMVYQSDLSTARYAQIGMALDLQHQIVVDVQHETILSNGDVWSTLWPGQNHYYRFTPTSQPTCARPNNLYVRHLTPTSAEIFWKTHPSDYYYQLQLQDTLGTTLFSTTTTDSVVVLQNLIPETKYTVLITTTCLNRNTSIPASTQFTTPCLRQEHNQIEYQNLYSPNVECWVGSASEPSRAQEVVNLGPYNRNSRHTVCTEQNVVDSYTNNQLRIVPTDCCYSVRLGNDNCGEQEEIIYTIPVDTLDYNILVLRYAIVEEDPNHSSDAQPRFEITISDSLGQEISPCYYRDFVAGAGDLFSGWNHTHSDGHNIVWRNWDAVGLDLTPLHGQTIKVRMNNRDCTGGMHFGYGYFALATYNKYLTSNNCDGIDSATFTAPLGFRYRWYPDEDSSLTLSTSRMLIVHQPGTYRCTLSFGADNSICSFTLSTYFGPKYPVAQFSIERQDPCGRRVRFINQSVISRNASHTDLTSYPCESYLWRFDDGTTSTQINPVHYFDEGDHTVTLIAMLANGDCIDSVQHTFHVEKTEYIIYDTICHGQGYQFYDRWLTESGTYTIEDNCQRHTLHLHTYYLHSEDVFDTICHGESLSWKGLVCDTAGAYTIVTPAGNNSCDSACTLNLTVLDKPHISYEIYHTCVGEAYYYMHLPDTFAYSWTSDPADAPEPYFSQDSLGNRILCIKPHIQSTYFLRYETLDSFHCSNTDTLLLPPVQDIAARMRVTPPYISNSCQELTAEDFSINADGRFWLVDEVLQADESPVLHIDLPAMPDSILLTLIAYNNSCQDTTSETIPVKRHSLFIPNIFTPAQHDNNRFQPIGFGITEYEIWIFDRRGSLIFHSADINEPWDGTYNGTPCKQEAYTYRIQYRTAEGDILSHNGTITLVR